MKRPTCATCAYWVRLYKHEDRAMGACQWSPPHGSENFPRLVDDEWCGQHNLFPAYLKSLECEVPIPVSERTPRQNPRQ